jgi:hypothetical protein
MMLRQFVFLKIEQVNAAVAYYNIKHFLGNSKSQPQITNCAHRHIVPFKESCTVNICLWD